VTRRESEGLDQGEQQQQDSPARAGQASSGAGIAGDPTVGGGGYGRLNEFQEMALAELVVALMVVLLSFLLGWAVGRI
jgi:hypothetical protein